MKFRIHFLLSDDSEDSVDVSGETIEEIRDKANAEISKRAAKDAWSQELPEAKP